MIAYPEKYVSFPSLIRVLVSIKRDFTSTSRFKMAGNEPAAPNSKTTFKPYKRQRLEDFKRNIRTQGQSVYDFSKFKSREKRPFVSSALASSSTSTPIGHVGFLSTDIPSQSREEQSLHTSEVIILFCTNFEIDPFTITAFL